MFEGYIEGAWEYQTKWSWVMNIISWTCLQGLYQECLNSTHTTDNWQTTELPTHSILKNQGPSAVVDKLADRFSLNFISFSQSAKFWKHGVVRNVVVIFSSWFVIYAKKKIKQNYVVFVPKTQSGETNYVWCQLII